MKTLIAILFLFAVTLTAETRHIQVIGDTAKPLPARLASKATHTLELTAEQYKTYVSPRFFKVVNGAPVAKTLEEIAAEDLAAKKVQAKKEAERLAGNLKENPIIQEGSDIYPFTQHSQTLFLAQFQNNLDVRVKRKGKKSEKMNKTKATLLFSKLSILLNNIEDAYEVDLDAIETGNFSLSNLKAIEANQISLRGE